jgi:hypothetical protein
LAALLGGLLLVISAEVGGDGLEYLLLGVHVGKVRVARKSLNLDKVTRRGA